MNKVVHFEIPCDDAKRASEFYSKAFAWNMNEIPEMKYTMAVTGPTDEQNMPLEKGFISGGLFNRADMDTPLPHPMVTMDVDNIEDSLKKVVEAGGEVVKERTTVGDMGAVAYFKDTEGNINGIWEDAKKG